MAHEIILHHYDESPFSEKVRLVLGLKSLPWRSVQISNIMPRPDLMPLTGGYRRTPVMQIGADVFCDTQIILRQLERQFPRPSLMPEATAGASWALTQWTDRGFFQASVGVIFGSLPEGTIPQAFLEDRAALSGRKFDLEALRQATPRARDQWRACAHFVEQQLADQEERDQAWLLAAEPSLADVSAYMNFWFVAGALPGAKELLEELPRCRAWMGRVAKIGHGERQEMTSGEALEVARAAEPDSEAAVDAGDPNGRRPGDRISVTPDDYGRIPVSGELVSSSPQHVAIRRHDETAGAVVVHFPKAGFHVAAC